MIGNPQVLSLFEINNQVKSGIRNLFPDSYWITGEISEMSVNQSGHCYLELIEKKADSDQIIARAKATIWAFTFRMLRPYFESMTGQRFSNGLKVMVQASIEFHEIYGFSLNIKDIEPNFTIGDLSRKRKEIIQRLMDEGVFHLNKELELSVVPQRLAVISSETAAGFGDFVNQLTSNRFGYSFKVRLFNAYMQGAETEQSIISALETIYESVADFDAVVIIRGGGSQADMECFNSYWLCYHLTQFPLPVITGIGHERDECIADLVAHTSVKTPTAAAEFIIGRMVEFDEYLDDLYLQMMNAATGQLQARKDVINKLSGTAVSITKLRLSTENQKMKMLGSLEEKSLKNFVQRKHQSLSVIQRRTGSNFVHVFNKTRLQLAMFHKTSFLLIRTLMEKEKNRLEQMGKKNQLLDPVHILKRGYTLTFSEGVLIKSPLQLKPGDRIESKWNDGTALSTIEEIHQPKE